MPVVIGNLKGKVDYTARRAIEQLAAFANGLEARTQQLHVQLATLPAPLTLAEIQKELSATGTAPLNVTGLPGLPTPTP